jgi:hypothetical protein
MRVVIDISDEDGNSMYGGRPGFLTPCHISDDGSIVLDIGDVRIQMSYGQFDKILDGILRWRWSSPPEKGAANLSADHPPPDWETMVQAIEQMQADERRTIAVDLHYVADQISGECPRPAKGDGKASKYFASGRLAGRKAGLLYAAELVKVRGEKFNLTPETDPE